MSKKKFSSEITILRHLRYNQRINQNVNRQFAMSSMQEKTWILVFIRCCKCLWMGFESVQEKKLRQLYGIMCHEWIIKLNPMLLKNVKINCLKHVFFWKICNKTVCKIAGITKHKNVLTGQKFKFIVKHLRSMQHVTLYSNENRLCVVQLQTISTFKWFITMY